MKVFICLFVCLFVCCTAPIKKRVNNTQNQAYIKELDSTKENNNFVNWDNIPIKKLPYKFSYVYDSIAEIKQMSHIKNILETETSINSLFSDNTIFKIKDSLFAKNGAYPYKGKGFFYERLPDKDNNKVILFVYENREQDYNLPYFELQIIDDDNDTKDKLIVVGAITYECGWNRNFIINKDYIVTVNDIEYCYDIENDKEIERREFSNRYKLTKEGMFKIIKK